jgi:hypothetical protein
VDVIQQIVHGGKESEMEDLIEHVIADSKLDVWERRTPCVQPDGHISNVLIRRHCAAILRHHGKTEIEWPIIAMRHVEGANSEANSNIFVESNHMPKCFLLPLHKGKVHLVRKVLLALPDSAQQKKVQAWCQKGPGRYLSTKLVQNLDKT